MFRRGEDGVYRSSLLSAQPWLDHGFGTRVSDNWPGEYARVRQVHSADVVPSDKAAELPDSAQGDGIVSSTPGLWIGIRTADCVPILIADPARHAVGAIHAGWRGTVASIASEGVGKLAQLWASEPHNLLAAIGPSIGRCCFEVGPEVAQEFRNLFPEATHLPRTIDLIEANRRQLVAAGVGAENIDVLGTCTVCGGPEFHSWRRDREVSGRMIAAIQVRRI